MAVDRGSLSARCTSSSRGRCLRWPRESTPSEVVPSRGGGQARRTAPWGASAGSKCPLGSAPSSAPAPPEGAPGGSGQLGTPRKRTAHWAPNHCLRGRRSHCASKHSGASHRGEAPRLTLTADPNPTPTLTLTLTRCQLQGGGSKEGCSFYAVYDGHGGARAASFCTEVSSTKAHSLYIACSCRAPWVRCTLRRAVRISLQRCPYAHTVHGRRLSRERAAAPRLQPSMPPALDASSPRCLQPSTSKVCTRQEPNPGP